MLKLRGAIKNFSKSIQRSTFQAIKGDSSSDLRNRSVALQIVSLLLRVASVDKSHAIRLQTGFSFYDLFCDAILRNRVLSLVAGTKISRLLYNFVRVPRFYWQPMTLWCRLQCMVADQLDSTLNERRYSVSCTLPVNYATFALSTLECQRGHEAFA